MGIEAVRGGVVVCDAGRSVSMPWAHWEAVVLATGGDDVGSGGDDG